MKKFTLSLLIGCMAIFNLSAQWQSVDRNKADKSGEIPAKVNFMAIADGKLYAATTDGIWESASMNGGDWTAFGMQGQEVTIINFKDAKLAMVNAPSSEDPTKTASQLYKWNGTAWELTKFNAEKKTGYSATTSFAQIRDDAGKLVFVIPTWGQDMWRSEDEGETWEKCPYAVDSYDPTLIIGQKTIGLFTYENDPAIYGTDKADYNNQYMIKSLDYGKTWEAFYVGNVFNPWAFHKRMYNGVETYYFGGEAGQNNTVLTSVDGGMSWLPSVGDDPIYWHNRCMLGKDDGPLFVMCAASNVYVFDDAKGTLKPLGTGLTITEANNKSLTHMVMTDEKLYCSSVMDGIQVFNLSEMSSVDDVALNKLSVYPNPTEDYIVVPADANSTVMVTDMRGAVLRQSAGDEVRIDVSDFTSGIYMVRYLQDGISQVEKIVKK